MTAIAFHRALTNAGLGYAGRSWSGFNIFGERRDIDAAGRLMDAGERLPSFQEELRNARAEIKRLEAELDQVRAILRDREGEIAFLKSDE